MQLKNKYFLYILGFFAILLIGFLIFRSLNSSSSSQTGKPPDYILSADQEHQVSVFVENFVSLYNSYSEEDYTNLTALGDYQTSQMQDKTTQLVKSLENSTPKGFEIRTQTETGTFTYKYTEANKILAAVKARVTETSLGSAQKSYEIIANLELLKQNANWVVNNIEINKK